MLLVLSLGAGLCCFLLMFIRYGEFYQFVNQPAPTWNDITPGRTTAAEVIQRLGSPNEINCYDYVGGLYFESDLMRGLLYGNPACRPGRTIYLYGPKTCDAMTYCTQVYIRFDKVWAVKVGSNNKIRSVQYSTPLASLIDQYGKPERVGWSRLSEGERAVLFAQRGIMAHVTALPNLRDSWVWTVMYFIPMQVDSAEQEFYLDANFLGPEKDYGYGDVRYGPMDPWGINP